MPFSAPATALLFATQLVNLASQPVVHIVPDRPFITKSNGGALVKIQNAPDQVSLPWPTPDAIAPGQPWFVDVVNFGPHDVTLAAGEHFTLKLHVSEHVHLEADGRQYRARR